MANTVVLEDLAKTVADKFSINAAVIDVDKINFMPELRKACEANACGKYGKNHTCPPHVGEINELISKAKTYEKAIVMQKIYPLEDSYDFEGMMVGGADFAKCLWEITDMASEKLDAPMILGCGGCDYCEKCTAPDKEPCRFPDKARASLESYGIQVSQLAQTAGMKYINGQNTVTYFGGIFVK